MGIKYSIKDIVLEKNEYVVTIAANKDSKGEMVFMVRTPVPSPNSIDVDTISKIAALFYTSGISLVTLKGVAYQPTVS